MDLMKLESQLQVTASLLKEASNNGWYIATSGAKAIDVTLASEIVVIDEWVDTFDDDYVHNLKIRIGGCIIALFRFDHIKVGYFKAKPMIVFCFA